MCKTRMGRELRNGSIACRPSSLNLDVLKGCVIFLCSTSFAFVISFFAFYHETCVFAFLKEKIHQNQAFKKCFPHGLLCH